MAERQAPRRARTAEEADFLAKWGSIGAQPSGRDAEDERWSAIDSLSIAESLLLDDLGYLWVRQGPSPTEGGEGATREITTPDGKEWLVPAGSGLHDVFRPDGVYLGTVQLPHDLAVQEIGEDHVLGIATDDLDIRYVRVYGLDRGGGGPG